MHRHLCNVAGVTKNQENTTAVKDHSKLPLIDTKEKKIHEFPSEQFRIMVFYDRSANKNIVEINV